MRLDPDRALERAGEPPPPRFHAAGEAICASTDAVNYAIVTPRLKSALIVISRGMLTHRYHARYELIEFAIYTLATRALGLVPLHAACIALNGKALLLIGDSGAGKSTMALHGALAGMQVISEDAVFVDARGLLVTGIANFLHLRPESLRLVGARARGKLRTAPMITRRSGISKLELDLRAVQGRPRSQPVRVQGVILLENRLARGAEPLTGVSPSMLLQALRRTQRYAWNHPDWQVFAQRVTTVAAYRLFRAGHPERTAVLLAKLLRPGC